MPVSYEDHREPCIIFEITSRHFPPHIHQHIECLLLLSGTLELGIGQDFFHMEKGDFALVFPDLIHHYQVFEKGRRRSIFLLADPAYTGSEKLLASKKCPENPVIRAADLHPDIRYALRELLNEKDQENLTEVRSILIQLILARTLPCYRMIDRETFGHPDLTFRTVEYIAGHFTEDLSLTDVAHELGVSPFALSRVFSGTFHTNFNRYVNKMRLDRAGELLRYSPHSITDICYESGFESQRTFNRAFKEYYRMSPSTYRQSLGLDAEEKQTGQERESETVPEQPKGE